jgi:hypothetical protein
MRIFTAVVKAIHLVDGKNLKRNLILQIGSFLRGWEALHLKSDSISSLKEEKNKRLDAVNIYMCTSTPQYAFIA